MFFTDGSKCKPEALVHNITGNEECMELAVETGPRLWDRLWEQLYVSPQIFLFRHGRYVATKRVKPDT